MKKEFLALIKEARDSNFNPVHSTDRLEPCKRCNDMLKWTWLYVFINGMDEETFKREIERTEAACSG